MKISYLVLVFVCTVAASFIASENSFANTNLITNGSFELGSSPPFGDWKTEVVGSTNITGWLVNSGDVDWEFSYWQPSDGQRSLDMNGNMPGSIQQAIQTTPGTSYQIDFDLAGNPDYGTTKTIRVTAGNYIEDYSFDSASYSLTNMGWVKQTMFFIASDNETTIEFKSTTDIGTGVYGPALDNVSVVALPVPEADTWAMLLAGLGLVGFMACRREA
jgi:choice-of-anchor C domain-containing protein